jgi:DNA primase
MSNPGDFAYTVKQQADIVRVVGEYVKLRKAGAQNFSGLCPFHGEKTPSFSVHATKQFFHCFGCGASGDVFTFVQKIENITFPEAVRAVAVKAGIPLPKQQYSSAEEAREAGLRGKLLDLHDRATAFFEEQLRRPEGAPAREYLQSRGLDEQTIKTFRIGFAPDSGFAMRDAVKSDFDLEVLKQSGIFSWKDEQGGAAALYSKFRNRIIFPIANEQGRVIAFTGRTLGSADKEKSGPKYLNSPETPIYSKSRVLFNLDKAKKAIRELDYSIVVEGQMDCISVYAAGLQNVIASSGTAFGEAQVKLLGRYSKNIVVNFDPDTAGAAATERSLALLIEEDFNIKVLQLETGLDPDLFIRKRGVEEYKAALRDSRKYFHYLIDHALQMFPPRSPENKTKAVNYLLPHIQRVPSRITRDELAAEAAQRIGIDSAVLRQELRSAAASRGAAKISPLGTAISDAEKTLIRALTSEDSAMRKQAMSALQSADIASVLDAGELIAALQVSSAEPMGAAQSDSDRRVLAQVMFEDAGELTPEWLDAAISALRRRALERRIRELQAQIDASARSGDQARVAQLTMEKVNVKRAMDAM